MFLAFSFNIYTTGEMINLSTLCPLVSSNNSFLFQNIFITLSHMMQEKIFLTEQKYHSELRLQKQSFLSLFYLYKDELNDSIENRSKYIY